MDTSRGAASVSGVVLAGTFPWSNSAFDRLAPRPLMPIAHRPLIGFSLAWLHEAGIERVVVCGNRDSRGLKAQLGRLPLGSSMFDYREDASPRGAAGCVRDAADLADADIYVVTDASAIPTLPLPELLAAHGESGAAVTVAVYDDRDAAPLSWPGQQVPAGVWVIGRRAVEAIACHGFVDIKEHLIPRLVRAGERVVTYRAGAPVPRVLNTDTYLAVHDVVTSEACMSCRPAAGYEIQGEALVHQDAEVAADAMLVGPVIVAAGARVDGGAVLVGPTSIGCDARIDAGAVVSRSSVWRRAHVGARTFVDRSIVGDDGLVDAERQVYRAVILGRPRARRPVPSPDAPRLPRPAA